MLRLRAISGISGMRGLNRKISYAANPGPPKLSKKEQEEWEKLQREATTNQALNMSPEELEKFAQDLKDGKASAEAKLAQGQQHPEYRHVYKDFEGEVNPETSEVGGPKQDPLRHGDWSFNGRVTDF